MSEALKTAPQSRLPDPEDEYSPSYFKRLLQTVEKDLSSLWTFASSWLRYRDTLRIVSDDAQTANFTVTVPAGFVIQTVYIRNTTANAVTGGIRIGTTDGGTEIVSSIPVGASEFVFYHDGGLISTTADSTIYIQAVTAWNSSSLDVRVQMEKLY